MQSLKMQRLGLLLMISCCRYGSVLISAWLGSRTETITTTTAPMAMVTQPVPPSMPFNTFRSYTAPMASQPQQQTPISSWEVSNALHCHRCSPLVGWGRVGRGGGGGWVLGTAPGARGLGRLLQGPENQSPCGRLAMR